MKRFSFGVFFIAPLLAACGGGGSSAGHLPPVSAPLASSRTDSQEIVEAQSDASQPLQPQYVSSTSDLLYVANVGNNSITVYRHDASGDTAPIRVIAGSKTGIKSPSQLSEDAKGNLYVANSPNFSDGTNPDAAILVFAHGANGNVAPIRKLAGPHTQIHNVEAMTVDQATGKIFVFDEPAVQDEGESAYLRFAPDATGDEAPYAVSQTGFLPAAELASDSTGKNLIEAGLAPCCTAANAGVQTLPKQFANGASPYPVYQWSGAAPSGVADDPTTRTYLATLDRYQVSVPGIYRFAEDTNGNFPVGVAPQKFKPAIVSIITSDTCGGQLALGYERNIYVAHTKASCPEDAVYVYAHDASGNAAPLRVLDGSATRLDRPSGIYEGQ